MFQKSFGIQKGYEYEGGREGYHVFPSKFFFSQFRKFSSGNFSEFHEFRVSKIFMTVRGLSRSSIDNLLSRSTEKLRSGTLLCFTKFLVSKKITDKTVGRGGVGTEYHDFPSKTLGTQCRTLP